MSQPVSENLTFVLSGSELPTERVGGQPDSHVEAFQFRDGMDGDVVGETPLGVTEVVKNDPHPRFNRVFRVLWTKGTGQKLRFVVREHQLMGKDTEIGEVALDLDLYIQDNQNVKIPLSQNPSSRLQGGYLLIQKTEPTAFILYARNLPNMDGGKGQSDPYCEVFWRRGKTGIDIPLGVTEVVNDEMNPDWVKTFEFPNYQKGTEQYWFFRVYDRDSLSKDDFIGEFLLEVDPFVRRRQTKIVKLDRSDGKAVLGIQPAEPFTNQ